MSDLSQSSTKSPTRSPSPASDCAVDESWSGTTVVLAVTGTVDMLTAPKLEAAIGAALDKHPAALIVDLIGVDFLASHGMRVLIQSHDDASGSVSFRVVADGPVTARPLTLMGITEIIATYPSLGEALRDLAA